ncbi:MAG: hypothetical protein QOJ50_1907 [Cryptosporangiaceae bacterium]|nr:hypothetical protein [Cryptosporangiaceae bacterium]
MNPAADAEMPKASLTSEHAYILLDGLTELEHAVRDTCPWEEYTGGDTDPKTSRDGYEQLMAEAREYLEYLI